MIQGLHPVLLIADDGPEFGLGHVRRMEYLQARLDPAVRKISRLITREKAFPFTEESLTLRDFSQVVCEQVSDAQPTLCVFDLNYARWNCTWGLVASALPEFTTTIGIDAPSDWAQNFDHVIHPGIAKPKGFEDVENWHGGPDWVFAPRSPDWKPSAGIAKVTVVTGSQAFPRFHRWLRPELAKLANSNTEVSWVVGKHLEARIPELTREDDQISYVTDENLTQRFAHSRVVLTRFGVTAFELVARGIPTIILPGWTKSEEPEVFEMERRGIAIIVRSKSEVGDIANEVVLDEQVQLRLSTLSKGVFPPEQEHPAKQLISSIISGDSDG